MKTRGLSVKPLNPQQRAFAEHYISTPAEKRDATASAIAAGYSPKTAKSQGSRLLTHPGVRDRIIAVDQSLRTKVAMIDRAWLLTEAVHLWETQLSDLFNEDGTLKPIHEMPKDAQKLVGGFEVTETTTDGGTRIRVGKVKIIDRLRVLDMIGRNTDVNAFGDREKAAAAGSFAELLRALTSAASKSEAIDVEKVLKLVGEGR